MDGFFLTPAARFQSLGDLTPPCPPFGKHSILSKLPYSLPATSAPPEQKMHNQSELTCPWVFMKVLPICFSLLFFLWHDWSSSFNIHFRIKSKLLHLVYGALHNMAFAHCLHHLLSSTLPGLSIISEMTCTVACLCVLAYDYPFHSVLYYLTSPHL